jgi:hypothetical protein
MQHYSQIHTTVDNIPKREKFPKIEVTQQLIIEMAKNVKTGRAVSVDGIPDTLFKIGRHKDCNET